MQFFRFERVAVAAVAVVAWSSSAAYAQSDDPIAFCRSNTATDAARIACLESAINTLMGSTAISAAPEAPTAPDAPAIANAPEAAAPAPTGIGAEQVAARREKELSPEKRKEKRKEKAPPTEAVIIDFAQTKQGQLVMVLDNGQVWAQRTGDNAVVRLREGEQPSVLIRRGAVSGYRMEISDPNLTIIVERLR